MADLDIDAAMGRSTDRFVDEITSMDQEQWLYRPTPGAWCASEVAEHLVISNRGILSRLSRGLTTPLDGPLGVADDEIPYLFYRGDEPPNVATPTGTWTDVDPAVRELVASSDALIAWHRDTDLDPRGSGAMHPVFGMLDAMQWLLFAQAHTERHRAQLFGLRRAHLSDL